MALYLPGRPNTPWLPGPRADYQQTGIVARRFDGVSAELRTSVGVDITGALTVAVLARSRTDAIGFRFLSQATAAAGNSFFLSKAVTSNAIILFTNTTSASSTATLLVADGWCLIVATKAAGAGVTPRLHIYKAGAWTHENGSAAINDPVTAAGGTTRFATTGNSGVFYPLDLAVAGQWNVALTDLQVEELSANSRTQDWYSDTGGTPIALWDFGQNDVGTSVTDLTSNGANQSSIVGTAAIGDGPPNWTYGTTITAANVPLGTASGVSSTSLALTTPTYIYGSYQAKVLPMVPSLYWPLDSSTGDLDISGNGYDPDPAGGSGGYTVGGYASSPVIGGTASTDLDGTDDGMLGVPYNPFVNGSVRTFVGWANRDTSGSYDCLAQPLDGSGGGDIPNIEIAPGSNVESWGGPSMISWAGAWPGTGQWVHWAYIIDQPNATGEFFVNGISQGVVSYGTLSYRAALTFGFGRNDFFDGKVAHIAVFERALTATEIASLASPVPPLTASGRASTSLVVSTPTPAPVYGTYKPILQAMGPALYWPLDGTDGATDQSGNGRDGTGQNSVSIGGYSGSPITGESTATDFNGSNQLVTSSYAPFANGTARTFTGWGYHDTDTTGTVFAGDGGSAFPWISVDDASANMRWFSDSSSSAAQWNAAWPGLGQWVHWALTFDESSDAAELFVNGVSKGPLTQAAAYTGSPGNFMVGARDGWTVFWDGKLAHVAVFERVLSATEIARLANPLPALTANGRSSATLVVSVPAPVSLATANGVSTTSLALTAPARVGLATAAGTSTASLFLTAQTKIPLDTAGAAATTSLAITAPTKITLGTAAGISTTSLALTAQTKIPLDTANAVSTASLVLFTPKLVPLDTAAATSTTSLGLTAPTKIALATAAGISSTSLSITAPTKIVLGTAAGISSTTLALTAQTKIALATAAGVSTTSLALTATARVTLGTAAATSTTTLALTAPTKIPLGTAAATSTTSITVVAGPGVITLGIANATSSTSLALKAPTKITLGTAAATSSTSLALTVPARIPLDTANATSAATLVLTALTGIPLGTVSVTSSASLIVTTPSLAVFVPLDTANGISTTSIEIDTHLLIPPEPEPGVYDFTIRRILTQYPAGTEVGVWAGEPDVYDNYGMRRIPPVDPVATATVTGDPFTITGLPEGDYFAIGTFQRKVRPRGDPDFETVLQTISFHVP